MEEPELDVGFDAPTEIAIEVVDGAPFGDPFGGDPIADLMALMPPEPEEEERELEQRIEENVAERDELSRMVGDRAEHLVDVTRKFLGAGRVRTAERSFGTYDGWRKALRQIDPQGRVEGNRDTAQAFNRLGVAAGEWDGERGIIYG